MSSSGPRPPLASAIGLSLVLAVFMAWLRFVIFPDAIVPLAYDLALLVALWHRHRVVHWSLATALVAMATFKIHFVVPDAALAGLSRWAVWSMQIVSMSFVAAVIEIINLLRRRLENRSRALDETNAELEAANEELTSREAEISVQNEQLQQQASELEQQAEELESHTEDLRGVNEELCKREEILQCLLELTDSYAFEEDTVRRICEFAPPLIGGADGSAVLDRTSDGMRILTSHGFPEPPEPTVIPLERSFAALVMERGETGYVADVSQRPDLQLPRAAARELFRSALSTPLRLRGAVVGVLELYSNQPRDWTREQLRLVEWLGTQCERVWEVSRLGDENRAIQAELRAINQDLEKRVAERTALAEERAARLRALASDLAQTEQRERSRLAQLLHDELQQYLVAAKLQTGLIRKRDSDGKLAAVAGQVEKLLSTAIETSRTLTVELSPAVLIQGGLIAGLDWLARSFNEKYGLLVTINVQPGLHVGDEDLKFLIFQAVRETLFNVVKHSGVDRAEVELAEADDHVTVQIRDRGKGFKLENGTLVNLSGFGLFGIQQRVEAVGGTLQLETRPGEGTSLTFTLPSRDAESRCQSLAEVQEAAPSPSKQPQGKSSGQVRLLLVDDHAIFRQGIANLLKAESDLHVVGEAADGRAALQEAARLLPDVVIMDLSMPVMDGVEATRRLLAQYPDLQVIGLSMHEAADRAGSMLEAGASAYLSKDRASEHLITAIRSCAAARLARGRADQPTG